MTTAGYAGIGTGRIGRWVRCLALAFLASPGQAGNAQVEEIKEPAITARDRSHWAFQPLVRPVVPAVAHREQIRNPVDHFILQRLEANGLRLMPEAERHVLIRRLSFDLTGLPPTPEEVDRFVSDASANAYAQLVDRLLASPAHGERWAQPWLDLARFAESDGFEHDQVRTNAWRYRDWVIRALNDDLPYDQFVRMQLAGDELSPGDSDAAIATGFLLSGPDMPDLNVQEERRNVVLNEITSTVGTSLLGLGLSCAQCHDHKYDPISQADFYRTRAFFENTIHVKRDRPLGYQISESPTNSPLTRLLVRGDFRRPGPVVEPAFLRIASLDGAKLALPIGRPTPEPSGRRSVLAAWITRPDHPLTLRVIANRLWQHHFGAPLAGTPNDFGLQGEKPTHPELLDWLATELPQRGWSLKAMHRLLVTSATYRQASHGHGEEWDRASKADPDNRLLSRMRRTRLTGETIRDAMLAVSGALNRDTGGPGVHPPLSAEITVTLLKDQWQVSSDVADHHRRSIYLFARRNLRYPMFDTFDRPDANASCGRRHESTTAPQSLMLLNSEFSQEMAQRLAGVAWAGEAGTLARAVERSYRLALGRPPSHGEARLALEFVNSQAEQLRTGGRTPATLSAPSPAAPTLDAFQAAALVDFCRALFNLNEFIYAD